MMRALLLVTVLLSVPASGLAAQLYLSPGGEDAGPCSEQQPCRTLERARDVVRGMTRDMEADITVFLREGTYIVSGVIFDVRDSGRNGFDVVYRAHPGERPVISGGRRITGWVPVDKGMFRDDVGALRFRQLYVDGARAVRARTPDAGEFIA